MSRQTFKKVTVCFEARPDGGLRVWSDDVPGLVLSHTDIDGVIDDVTTALRVILSHQLKAEIDVAPLGNIREALEDQGIVAPNRPMGRQEYVAIYH